MHNKSVESYKMGRADASHFEPHANRYLAMRYVILLAACLAAAGCASSPRARVRWESWAIHITGYDVPPPASNPYSDKLGQREYLRFYHEAYLTTMWQDCSVHSTISPISEHSEAAVAGHYDGQHDADLAKREYWARQGRAYHRFGGWGNHRCQLAGQRSAGQGCPEVRGAQ